MTEDTLQYYPTPRTLADAAWEMFESREVTRLLEPSAGTGELLAPLLKDANRGLHRSYRGPRVDIDVVELDTRHHAQLRELGVTIVGYDFLQQQSCAIYSHILMNPPFAQGARHVLHAWNTLYEGEIVAVLNAETLRNPCSAERAHLARLVQEHGRVRFIADAFVGEEVMREARVEVALVHLTKRVADSELLGDVTEGLTRERDLPDTPQMETPHELALPVGFVEQVVGDFERAVDAARESAIARVRAERTAARLGRTMQSMQARGEDAQVSRAAPAAGLVRKLFAADYETLKNAAWAQVIRSTHVLSRLSAGTQRRVEAQFKDIQALEFTVTNVYGFLQGLVASADDIQKQMMCDVFDLVTRYHSDNRVYYMGWKSNDRHRTAGMRIKRTRFILPGEKHTSWRATVSFELRRMLSDFDKVFALLDGKRAPVFGLEALFSDPEKFKQLCDGARLSSDYFEVRYYPGAGTIHFFARNPELIERLNRTVGTYRRWLPENLEGTSEDFRKQYTQAEKFHAQVVAEFGRRSKHASEWSARSERGLTSTDATVAEQAHAAMSESLESVLEAHGIRPFEALSDESARAPLLLVG